MQALGWTCREVRAGEQANWRSSSGDYTCIPAAERNPNRGALGLAPWQWALPLEGAPRPRGRLGTGGRVQRWCPNTLCCFPWAQRLGRVIRITFLTLNKEVETQALKLWEYVNQTKPLLHLSQKRASTITEWEQGLCVGMKLGHLSHFKWPVSSPQQVYWLLLYF